MRIEKANEKSNLECVGRALREQTCALNVRAKKWMFTLYLKHGVLIVSDTILPFSLNSTDMT